MEGRGSGSRDDRPSKVVAWRDILTWVFGIDCLREKRGPGKFTGAEGCGLDMDEMVIL